jgi:FtsP/CotA-like multicopper oxidase with cupredoxin domain
MSFVSRRSFLIGAGAGIGALVLGACGSPSNSFSPANAVEEAERLRRREGTPVRVVDLATVAGPIELGPLVVESWSYGGTVPGPEIRIRAGEVLQVHLRNQLPTETTIHWHGIALRNDMDGVPGVTQDPVLAGGEFTYEFTVPDPGTYFFHPHVGVQLDRGLYGSLIVEDPSEPGGYDREVVMVLDDWTDGIGEAPDDILARLTAGGMDHSGMGMGSEDSGMAMSDVLGGDAGDVVYPLYLINGRAANEPQVIEAKSRERIRFRIINAASDTAFRLAVGGHSFTVTHSDGFPVKPVEGEALLIGMGERYDL